MTEDICELSEGNIKVLETIPKMMLHPKYRRKLREITIDFLSEGYMIEELKKQIKGLGMINKKGVKIR